MDEFTTKHSKLDFDSSSKAVTGKKGYDGGKWFSAYGKISIPSSSNQHCRWDLKFDPLGHSHVHNYCIGLSTFRNTTKPFQRNTKELNYSYIPVHNLIGCKYQANN